MRDAAITLRALPEQCALIERAASVVGKKRSDFILDAACERAQAVVFDQVCFGSNAYKFKHLNAMLDAPLASNVGLKRLLAVKAPWSVGLGSERDGC